MRNILSLILLLSQICYIVSSGVTQINDRIKSVKPNSKFNQTASRISTDVHKSEKIMTLTGKNDTLHKDLYQNGEEKNINERSFVIINQKTKMSKKLFTGAQKPLPYSKLYGQNPSSHVENIVLLDNPQKYSYGFMDVQLNDEKDDSDFIINSSNNQFMVNIKEHEDYQKTSPHDYIPMYHHYLELLRKPDFRINNI